MSLATLKKAILAEAQKEAAQIQDSLHARTETEQQRILDRAQEIEQSIIEAAEREGANQARRKRQEAELSGKAAVLRAKEEELSKLESALVDELVEQESEDLIRGLLDLLPDQEGEIVPGQLHKDVVKKVAGKHTVTNSTIPGEGGFIFRGKTAEADLTIRHLVHSLFKKHRAKLASLLFS